MRSCFIFWLSIIFPACAQFDARGGSLGFLLLNDGGAVAGTTETVQSEDSDWDLDDWCCRRTLSVDGSGLSATLSDVPLLIRLDATRIDYARAGTSGEDLRFFDADGVRLAHEIESYASAGESIVWIKIPTLDVTGATLRMYYGNTSAADDQQVADVWSSNYNLVLHLSETGGNGSARADSSGTSTSGSFVDANSNSDPTAAGRIGTGDDLNGDADIINMGDQATFYLNNFTITGWFRTGTAGPISILSRNSIESNRNYWLGIWGVLAPHTTNSLAFRTSSGGAIDVTLTTAAALNDNNWHYFAAVMDDGVLASLYVDGQAALTAVPAGTVDFPVEPLHIGHDNFTLGARYFDGTLDELRITATARSADWIDFQYLSQTDAAVSFGAEETRP